jgi:hypothetical protein
MPNTDKPVPKPGFYRTSPKKATFGCFPAEYGTVASKSGILKLLLISVYYSLYVIIVNTVRLLDWNPPSMTILCP